MSIRKALLVIFGILPLLFLLIIGAEVMLARRGEHLDAPNGLDGQVGVAKASKPLRVVWLGDSTAAGVGASSVDTSLPRQVAAGLNRSVSLTVLADSGARVSDLVDDQVPRVAGLAPDLVFVSVGANDVTHGTARGSFSRKYRELLQSMPPKARVIVLGVPDMGSPRRLAQPLRTVAGMRGRALDRSLKKVAADEKRTYVDIEGATRPFFRSDPDKYFAADEYHPSDAGYALWAKAVLEATKKLKF